MNRFLWYRKWKKGIWYYNRYIFDMGIVCIFKYERHMPNDNGRNIRIENYN